ncbi:MAG: sulfurtransferase TusA family protein [Candidatus Sumerlaeia bacterium]|nr:sulfurtransferase TusA family protein [Candidatus Sumerlaeia bacterium]
MIEDPIAARLDITLDVCPMTFVKTKLELEDLEVGQVLEVHVRQGESLDNVVRSSLEDGHVVLSNTEQDGGIHRLLIRRG